MGPLYKNLGSTSHAPGLIFQHNNSNTVCTLAMWTVETYLEAQAEANLGQTLFQTGSLEIAIAQRSLAGTQAQDRQHPIMGAGR